MSEAWKQWEGRQVDGKFQLRQYLGGSEHSAVFLTERGEPAQKAAIKFIQVEGTATELQLSRWQRAAKLSHPHLLQLFECGRCRIGDFNLLYVVMEYANENLAQFLPQRPLTPAETRDVLAPALTALGYLHGEGLVHGHIQPSNVLAIEDQLKLSSDSVSPAPAAKTEENKKGEQITGSEGQPQEAASVSSSATLRRPSPYCAPEAVKGTISPAGDIWSLGITVVETLTQRVPALDYSSRQDPALPETLPALFLDIARHCLKREPQARWTVAEIAERLHPSAPAPAATPLASVVNPALVPAAAPAPAAITATASAGAPASAPPARLSAPPASKTEPYHIPAARPPLQSYSAAARSDSKHHEMALPKLKQPPLLPKLNYFVLGLALGFVLIGLLGLRLYTHRSPVQQQTASVAPEQPAAPQAAQPAARTKTQQKSGQKASPGAANSAAQASQRPTQTPAQSAVKATSEKQPVSSAKTIAPSPHSDSLAAATVPAKLAASSPTASRVPGEVLSQVLPEISQKARSTIWGTVRVGIKVHVDPMGNVTGAELSSPGPSKVFADLALRAAKNWDFAPAKLDGHNVASDWIIRFQFTQSDTKVYPAEVP